MSFVTKFLTTTAARLNSIPIVNGQIIAVSDKPGWYYDMKNVRRAMNGNVISTSLPESGEADTLYVVSNDEENVSGVYIWSGFNFVKICGLDNEKVKTDTSSAAKVYLVGSVTAESSSETLVKNSDVYIDLNTGKLSGVITGSAVADDSNQQISSTYIKEISASKEGSKVTFTITKGDGSTSTFEVEDNGVTNDIFEGADANNPGKSGLVPSPNAGYQSRFLRGDGTWSDIKDSTLSFEIALARANIQSGDSLSVAFGKLARYCADLEEVAFTGSYRNLSDTPDSLKNPKALKFTGGSTATYDGSSEQSVAIPTTLPANGGNATTAEKLKISRSLKTKLDGTATATFDGSADQDAIPVTGVLPVANGGTGATSFVANRALIGNEMDALATSDWCAIQEVNFNPGYAPEPGWRRICKITGAHSSFQFLLFVSGEEWGGSPSSAILAVSSRYLDASINVLICSRVGHIQQIRLVHADDQYSNNYWVDVYTRYITGTMQIQRLQFLGNVSITDINTVTPTPVFTEEVIPTVTCILSTT